MSSTRPFGSRPLPPPVAVPEFEGGDAPTMAPPPGGPPPPPGPPQPTPVVPPGVVSAIPAALRNNDAPSGPDEDTEIDQSELEEALQVVSVRSTRLRLAFTGLLFIIVGLAIAAIWWGSNRPATATPEEIGTCLLYTSPSPRDRTRSRMPSSA